MKRTLLIPVLAIWMPVLAFATNVGGIISTNTTWAKANSPYIVTANLLVDEGTTLTIEPGVTVLVEQDMKFYVDGGIRAEGTATDRIVFTSNMANPPEKDAWSGLYCRKGNVADSAVLQYCDIKYGGVNAEYVPLVIKNSTIMRARWGLRLNEGTVLANDNVIDSCYYGISTWKTYGGISGNEIKRSHEGAIDIIYTTVDVMNNYLHDNSRGIYINYGGDGQIKGNRIMNSTYAGIMFSECTATQPISDNIIAYNAHGMEINSSKIIMSHNTFKYNDIGVYIKWNDDNFTFEYNCIDSNNLNVKNTSPYELTFPNNYWGTTDSATIHSRIFDFKDDFVSGYVRFMPYLGQVDANCAIVGTPPVTGLTQITPAKEEIQVYPNPFTSVFTIELPESITGDLQVFNVAGSKMLSINVAGKKTVQVNMSEYPVGLYIYSLTTTSGKTMTGKITRQ